MTIVNETRFDRTGEPVTTIDPLSAAFRASASGDMAVSTTKSPLLSHVSPASSSAFHAAAAAAQLAVVPCCSTDTSATELVELMPITVTQ